MLTKPKFLKGEFMGYEHMIKKLLPTTGSVEVQRDSPLREHPEHIHPTNETLLILEGEITFNAYGEEMKAYPGDRLLLPKGTPHSSIAGENGCIYIIALEYVS